MPADYDGDVVSPGTYQTAVVEEAFRIAPDLLCQAVEYVAFVQRVSEEAGALGWTRTNQGNVIFISALPNEAAEFNLDPNRSPSRNGRSVQIGTVGAILHEAAHAGHHLIDAQSDLSSKPPPDVWTNAAQTFGANLVEEHRLKGGFMEDEWVRMHEAFVDEEMAQGYYENSGRGSIADANLTEAGFMSASGGTKPSDDIAETTSWTLLAHYLDQTGERPLVNKMEDFICQELRASQEVAVSFEHAAAYTKLSTLHDLGFLTDETFDWCTGLVGDRFNDPTLDPGFHIYDLESQITPHIGASLTNDVSGKMGERDGSGGIVYFQMDATGTLRIGNDEDGYVPHAAELSLMLDLGQRNFAGDIDDVSWPRGIYCLTSPGLAVLGGSRFIATFPDASSNTTWATDGYVLVVRASNSGSRGLPTSSTRSGRSPPPRFQSRSRSSTRSSSSSSSSSARAAACVPAQRLGRDEQIGHPGLPTYANVEHRTSEQQKGPLPSKAADPPNHARTSECSGSDALGDVGVPGRLRVAHGLLANSGLDGEVVLLGHLFGSDEGEHLRDLYQERRELFEMAQRQIGDALLFDGKAEGVQRGVAHRGEAECGIVVAEHPRHLVLADLVVEAGHDARRGGDGFLQGGLPFAAVLLREVRERLDVRLQRPLDLDEQLVRLQVVADLVLSPLALDSLKDVPLHRLHIGEVLLDGFGAFIGHVVSPPFCTGIE